MKRILILLALLLSPATAQQFQPIHNGKLTSALNGNSQNIVSLNRLGSGGTTPLSRIHFVSEGSPTTLADGIRWGSDVGIYRERSNTIKLQGNLVVTGSIAGADGVVLLGGDNIFTGANTFNGATTVGGALEFQTGFTVADNTVRDAIRDSLDLVPGANVQAYSARLLDIAALNPQDSYVIVGNGSTWVAETGGTLRTSLGLGTSNDVTFAAIAGTTLNLSGAATVNGKLTAAAALSDSTGLQLGAAGAWYGSGSGIVTDDPLTANNSVVLGDQTTDEVTITGLLKLSSGGDVALQRTSSGILTVTGAMVIPSATLAAPLGTASGGLGLNNGSATANQIPYTSATGTFSLTGLSTLARSLLTDTSESAMRTRLQLGGSALLNVGTSSGTVAAGDDSRLTNSRAPTGSAAGDSSDIEGTYPASVTIKANAVALGTDTTGNYVTSLTAGTGVTLGGTNGAESAVPVIDIGQSVATNATPTFGGLTLTGALGGKTATLSTSLTTVNLSVTGTATFTSPPSFTGLTLESLTLNQGGTSVGRVAGLVQTLTVNVDKDHPQATDTRTGLLATELFRPFTTVSAANTASGAGGLVRVMPASTEYSVPAEFGLDRRTYELVGGASINGLTTTADVDYTITGAGSVTGDVSLDNSAAVISIRVPVVGNVTVTSGTLDIYGQVTGNVTVNGGTVRIFDRVTGTVTVTGGSLALTDPPVSATEVTGGLLQLDGGIAANLTVSVGEVRHRKTGTGTLTVSSGTVSLDGPWTGDLTASGGTVELRAPAVGVATVSGGTLNVRSTWTRSNSGIALTLSSGTLNLYEGAAVYASSATETAISRSGGTWNVWGGYALRGVTSGTVVSVGKAFTPTAKLTVAMTVNATVTPGSSPVILFTSTGALLEVTLSATGAVPDHYYTLLGPASNSVRILDSGVAQLATACDLDAGDTLCLFFDGTNFREVSRSAN